MEVKIILLGIIPSINELREDNSDIISINLFYDNTQINIQNLEKSIQKKEKICFKIFSNQYSSINVKLNLIRNMNTIIGTANFKLVNDIKWVNIVKNNNIKKLNTIIKINLNCDINELNLPKENNIFPYFSKKTKITSRERKQKTDEFKQLTSRTNIKEISVKKKQKNSETNLKIMETEGNKSSNKTLSGHSSFHKTYSSRKKKLTRSLILESKEKKKKNEKRTLHNSQSNLESYFLQKFRNFSKEQIEKDLSKLEDNIISQSYKNTIKQDSDIIGKRKLTNIFSFSSLTDTNYFFDNNQTSHYFNIEDYEIKKKAFFNYYSKEFILNIDNDLLQLETQIMLEKIFDLFNTFNIQKKVILKNYNNYKSAFISFSRNYLDLYKKYDKLKKKNRKNEFNEISNNMNKKFFNEFNKKNQPNLLIQEVNLWKNIANDCIINENLFNIRKNKLIEIFLSISLKNKSKLTALAKKFFNEMNEKICNLDYTFSNDNSNSLIQTSNSFGSKLSIGTSSSTLFSSINLGNKTSDEKINKQNLNKPLNPNNRLIIKKI
jgi:hypothetical protein